MKWVATVFNFSENKFILVIFFAALFIRIFAIFLNYDYLTPKRDAVFYDTRAVFILEGKGLVDYDGNPTAVIGPIYPFFLAFIYFLFGHNQAYVMIIQSILSALTCVFIYLTARNIFSQKVGKLAGIIAMIWPPFVLFSYYGGPGFILTENIYIFLFMALNYYISSIKTFHLIDCIISGLISALIILTRVTGIYVPVLFVIYLWIIVGTRKKIIMPLLVFLITLALTIAPWLTRNYILLKKVSLMADAETPSYLSVITTAFPDLAKKWNIVSKELETAIYQKEGSAYISKKWQVAEGSVNSEIKRKIFDDALENPGRYFKFILRNLKIFWSPYFNPLKGQTLVKFNFTYVFIMPFVVAGVFISILKRNKRSFFAMGLILGSTFIHLFIWSCERYRYPIEPQLIIFVAAGFFYLMYIFSNLRQRITFFSLVGLFFIINLLAYLNSDLAIKLISRLTP